MGSFPAPLPCVPRRERQTLQVHRRRPAGLPPLQTPVASGVPRWPSLLSDLASKSGLPTCSPRFGTLLERVRTQESAVLALNGVLYRTALQNSPDGVGGAVLPRPLGRATLAAPRPAHGPEALHAGVCSCHRGAATWARLSSVPAAPSSLSGGQPPFRSYLGTLSSHPLS